MVRDVALPAPDISIHPVGGQGSDVVGPMQLGLLQHFGLEPLHVLMEIGCGVGRLTYKLTDYISASGRYCGFDLRSDAITWLRDNYGSALKNFEFELLDVYNKRYNPNGTMKPQAVRFPYKDQTFDMACAFSVFTHMRARDIETYLRETQRVLKPKGRLLATFFAMEPGDRAPRYGTKPFRRLWPRLDTWTLDRRTPEAAIGFSTARIDRLVSRAGLHVLSKTRGYWHGTKRDEAPYCWAHQDVYVLTREV